MKMKEASAVRITSITSLALIGKPEGQFPIFATAVQLVMAISSARKNIIP